MDVKYGSLEEAVRALVTETNNLDDPITKYNTNASTIGDGGSVWNGTAANEAKPILDKLQKDIDDLQLLCHNFAETIGVSLENYMEADNKAVSGMYNDINI